jgi:hypothetical protein
MKKEEAVEQASLFDQKKYKGVMPQTYQIEPPAANHSVLKTLLAYTPIYGVGDSPNIRLMISPEI